jgi:hypothetical protein
MSFQPSHSALRIKSYLNGQSDKPNSMIDTTYKARRNPYVIVNARYGLTIYLPQVVLTLMSESLFKIFDFKEV